MMKRNICTCKVQVGAVILEQTSECYTIPSIAWGGGGTHINTCDLSHAPTPSAIGRLEDNWTTMLLTELQSLLHIGNCARGARNNLNSWRQQE